MTLRTVLARLLFAGGRAGLSRVSGLTVAPDDVIVAECDDRVSQDGLDRIRGLLEHAWPGRTVVVLDRSIRLTVVRDTAARHDPAGLET